MSQPGRMLVVGDSDVHDPGRRLHALVRILRRRDGPSRSARSRRTGARRGSRGANETVPRRRDVRGPGRSGGRRSIFLRRNGAAYSGEVPGRCDRNPHPRFQGRPRRARGRVRLPPRCPEPQHRDRPPAHAVRPAAGKVRPLPIRCAPGGERRARGKVRNHGRLGETRAEIEETLNDLAAAGCRIVTVGQYLQPSRKSLPVTRFYVSDEFEEISRLGRAMGIDRVSAGPSSGRRITPQDRLKVNR